MSSLESAICFSLILVLLAFMIAGPEAIALDSFQTAKDGGNELFYMEKDRDVLYKNNVRGVDCYDASPEKLCTFLTGISDNFRLFYGTTFDLANEQAGKEAPDEEN